MSNISNKEREEKRQRLHAKCLEMAYREVIEEVKDAINENTEYMHRASARGDKDAEGYYQRQCDFLSERLEDEKARKEEAKYNLKEFPDRYLDMVKAEDREKKNKERIELWKARETAKAEWKAEQRKAERQPMDTDTTATECVSIPSIIQLYVNKDIRKLINTICKRFNLSTPKDAITHALETLVSNSNTFTAQRPDVVLELNKDATSTINVSNSDNNVSICNNTPEDVPKTELGYIVEDVLKAVVVT